MPYGLKKVSGGYKVGNKHSGKTYSKAPQTKAMAKRQLAALYANTKDESVFERKLALVLEGLK